MDPTRRLGKYVLLEPVGKGGMGWVYKARSPEGAEVAVKLLVARTPDALARFQREQRLQQLLGEEKGFVPILDGGVAPEGAYLVMPFLRGGTLRSRIDAGRLSFREAVELVRHLAEAMGRAHAQGIVHRDLKPENILFTSDGRPLITDLGVGKHFGVGEGASQSVGLSGTGELRGTPGYMPLEQLRDSKHAGPPADVFALGAILHECLTGEPAFAGRPLIEMFAKLELPVGGALREVRPDVPAWAVRVTERALASEPHERFADGAALARALGGESVLSLRARRAVKPALAVALVGLAVAGALGLAARRGLPAATDDATRTKQTESRVTAGDRAAPSYDEALAKRGSGRLRAGEVEAALTDLLNAVKGRNVPAWVWAELAHAYRTRKQYDLAASHVERALQADSKSAVALAERALVRIELAAPGALDDARRAVELDPKLAAAHRALAAAQLLLASNRSEAEAEAALAVELDPRDHEAWFFLGVARGELGDLDRGVEALERSVAAAPGFARGWSSLGSIQIKKGLIREGIASLNSAIALDPKTRGAWCSRAEARRMIGDFDLAIEDATEALRLLPSYAAARLTRGIAYRQSGRLVDALSDLELAVRHDPSLASAWAARAATRLDMGDAKGALDDAVEATRLDPAFVAAWIDRAEALTRLGERRRALEAVTEAIRLKPDSSGAYAVRGNLLRDANPQGAIADFTKVLELDPMNRAARLNRAGVRMSVGQLDLALADADRAIRDSPQSSEAWVIRGTIRLTAGQDDLAIADFDRALELQPRFMDALMNRGNAWRNKGNSENAIRDYTRALELDPRLVGGWINRGIVRAKIGQLAEAEADLDRALELSPGHPTATAEKQRLKSKR